MPDNSLKVWFLASDPLVSTYDEFHEQFGNDEVVLLKLETEGRVFDKSYLRWLERLTQKIEIVDGVFQVHSILSVQDIKDSEDGLEFDDLIPDLDMSQEQLDAIFADTLNNVLIGDKLVDASGKQCMLWIELLASEDFDARRGQIVHDIQDVVDEYKIENRFAFGGLSIIYTALNDITEQEVGFYFALCFLLILGVIIGLFRDWRIVLATVGVIVVANSFTLGVYGLLGYQVNLMTVMLPALIVILGIADIIHFPTAYLNVRTQFPYKSARECTCDALKQIALPCFLTTATTACGFLSMTTAPMAIIRDYGLFTALGLFSAFLVSFVFMALAFANNGSAKKPRLVIISAILQHCKSMLFKSPKTIGCLIGVLGIVGFAGAFFIKVDTYTLGYMADDSRVVQDHNYIMDTWGRYSNLEALFYPAEGRTMDTADLVNATETFSKRVEVLPEVRHVFGIDDLYRRMETVFSGKSSQNQPFTEASIEQFNLLLDSEFFIWDREDPEFSENVLQMFVTEDREVGRMTLVAEIGSAGNVARIIEKVKRIADETFEDMGTFEMAGYMPLYVKIIDYVMQSQVRSFFLTVFILTLIMYIWTRSFTLALLSLIPNLFPVSIIFGVMGFLGITMDIGTAVIIAIVMGISIDDTIHFIHYWKIGLRRGLCWEENVTYVYAHAGKAIFVTTLLLLIGFPIMLLSQLKSVFYFGLLTSIAAISAFIADLFLLPLLLRYIPNKGRNKS